MSERKGMEYIEELKAALRILDWLETMGLEDVPRIRKKLLEAVEVSKARYTKEILEKLDEISLLVSEKEPRARLELSDFFYVLKGYIVHIAIEKRMAKNAQNQPVPVPPLVSERPVGSKTTAIMFPVGPEEKKAE